MPNREEIHICAEQLLLATQLGAVAAQTSAALDTQGFDSAHFNLHIGAALVAGLVYKITECDTVGGGYTDAPASAVIDDAPTPVANKTIRVAYVGAKQFCKLVVTPGGATDITITGHKGYAAQKPVANPA